eukprot:scaffold1518_cov331-Pavlova_lutheri.AAC.42
MSYFLCVRCRRERSIRSVRSKPGFRKGLNPKRSRFRTRIDRGRIGQQDGYEPDPTSDGSSRSGWFLAAFQERQALSSSNAKESNDHAYPETVVTVENVGDGTHATGLLRLWRCVDCGGEKEAGGGTRERKDRDGCSPSDALRTRGLWLTRIFRKIVVTKHSFVQEIPSCAASAGIAFCTRRERPEVSERECTAEVHV